MTEQTAMLLPADLPELESGHVHTQAEPRTFPSRGVAIATGLLGMTAAVAMWASGPHGGISQVKVNAVVALDEDNQTENVDEEVAVVLAEMEDLDGDEDGFKKTFDVIDKDSDGSITGEELNNFVSPMYGGPSPEMTDRMIRSVDQGDGKVDFEEFSSHPDTDMQVAYALAVVESFGGIDANADGQVEGSEIEETLKGRGKEIPPEDVAAVIKRADKDGDENIDIEEFRQWLNSESWSDTKATVYNILFENSDKGMQEAMENGMSAEDLQKVFDMIDKNGDGSLSGKEFAKFIGVPEDQLDMVELYVIRELDQGNGKIEFDEFKSHPSSEFAVESEMELIELFADFDKNEDAKITEDELQGALTEWGGEVPEEQVSDVIAHADGNGDGGVDYDEFKAYLFSDAFPDEKETLRVIVEGQKQLERDEHALKHTFGQIDKDDDGSITEEELAEYVGIFSPHGQPSEEEVKGMIAQVDTDGNGKVDFEEFKAHPDARDAAQFEMYLLETFEFFDGDHDGLVAKEEVAQWMMTEEQTADFLAGGDDDGDEKLNFSEFKKAYVKFMAPPVNYDDSSAA